VKSECFSRLGALSVLAVVAACTTAKPVSPGVEDVHRRAVVVDAHDDITEAVVYGGYDFAVRHDSSTDTDLPRMREGGLDAEVFAIWINPNRVPRERWSVEAEHELVTARERLSAAGLKLARTAREVRDNAAHGVTSALFGLEGGYMLGEGTPDEMLARLRRFGELGVRYLTLTHSMHSSRAEWWLGVREFLPWFSRPASVRGSQARAGRARARGIEA
jgi:membrane dipeptidase